MTINTKLGAVLMKLKTTMTNGNCGQLSEKVIFSRFSLLVWNRFQEYSFNRQKNIVVALSHSL